MMSLHQQQQIPTAPLSDKRNYFYYLQNGFKVCRPCELFVKWLGRQCPFCGKQLSIRPSSNKSRQKFRKALENGVKFELIRWDARSCSGCGSASPKHFRYMAGGKKYPNWFKDGKGGHLCHSCWEKSR